MGDLKNIVGKYLGKQLASESDSYKRYKATFQVDDKDWSFTLFTPWTKKSGETKAGVAPQDLEEGHYYKIGYTEFIKDGMKFPAKTAVSIFEAKESDAQGQNIEVSLPTKQNEGIDVHGELVTDLINTYFVNVPKDKRNINHFVGTIYRTLNESLVQPLADEYNRIEEGME